MLVQEISQLSSPQALDIDKTPELYQPIPEIFNDKAFEENFNQIIGRLNSHIYNQNIHRQIKPVKSVSETIQDEDQKR